MKRESMRQLVDLFKTPIDICMAVLVIPSGIVLLLFRMLGVGRLKYSRAVLRMIGVFPIRDHYYEPLFNPAHLTDDLSADRQLPGIDLDEDEQLELIKNGSSSY